MSVETDFVAALDAHAALTALVDTRISKNAVAAGAELPFVVFVASHEPELGIDGQVIATRSTFTVECWGKEAPDAAEVADAAAAALGAYSATQTEKHATVTARSSVYDGDLDLNAEVLTVEWWDT